MENTVRYIHALNDNIQRLEKAIEAEHEARIREEAAAKEHVQRLKDQLREMKTEVQFAQRFEEAGSQAQIHTLRRVHAQDESRLRRLLAELRESVDREEKAFRLSEDFLLRKQARAEETLGGWQNRAGGEIKDISDKLERLTLERERVLSELKTNEEALRRETAEKDSREEAARRKLEEEKLFLRRVVVCQKMIRGFLARRRVVQMIKEKKAAEKKAKAEKKKDKKKK